MRSVKIVGTGSYLPGEPVTNDQLREYLGGLGEYYSSLIKIHQRHWAKDLKTGVISEKNSDMATKAAINALNNAGVDAKQVDLIIVSTDTPDCLSPPTVTFVQENLSIPECCVIELSASCSGAIQALSIAAQFIQSGKYDTALVIGSELKSFFFHVNYPGNTREDIFNMFIFGDGAGAAVLQGCDDENTGIGAYRINSCGVGHEPGMILPGGIGLIKSELLTPPRKYQDFGKVRKMESRMFRRLIGEIPKWINLKIDEIDKIVFPVEISVLVPLIPGLRQFQEKAFTLTPKIGFVASASSYIVLDDMNRRGLLRRGERIILLNLDGSKWIYSFMLIEW